MATTARAILIAGLVQINPWNPVTQAFDGYGESLDADKYEITPETEEVTSESRSHLDWGQARATVNKPRPTTFSLALSASSVKALAMQFQGRVEALSQSSGTLADVPVTVTAIGIWLPLGKRNIAEAGFTVEPSGGGTPYVRGTHYEVNWNRGEIRFLPGAAGNPAVAAVVDVSGTYSAVDGKRIVGGAITQVRCKARLDGENKVNGEVVESEVFDCTLSTANGYDFLSGEYTAIELTGKITGGYVIDFPQRDGE
jgi:hypothetical protein